MKYLDVRAAPALTFVFLVSSFSQTACSPNRVEGKRRQRAVGHQTIQSPMLSDLGGRRLAISVPRSWHIVRQDPSQEWGGHAYSFEVALASSGQPQNDGHAGNQPMLYVYVDRTYRLRIDWDGGLYRSRYKTDQGLTAYVDASSAVREWTYQIPITRTHVLVVQFNGKNGNPKLFANAVKGIISTLTVSPKPTSLFWGTKGQLLYVGPIKNQKTLPTTGPLGSPLANQLRR